MTPFCATLEVQDDKVFPELELINTPSPRNNIVAECAGTMGGSTFYAKVIIT